YAGTALRPELPIYVEYPANAISAPPDNQSVRQYAPLRCYRWQSRWGACSCHMLAGWAELHGYRVTLLLRQSPVATEDALLRYWRSDCWATPAFRVVASDYAGTPPYA